MSKNTTATCKHCGGQICSINWQHWYHLIINPSSLHVAEPATPAKPVRNPQPHLDAILQQPVQCQVEADGDCVWA